MNSAANSQLLQMKIRFFSISVFATIAFALILTGIFSSDTTLILASIPFIVMAFVSHYIIMLLGYIEDFLFAREVKRLLEEKYHYEILVKGLELFFSRRDQMSSLKKNKNYIRYLSSFNHISKRLDWLNEVRYGDRFDIGDYAQHNNCLYQVVSFCTIKGGLDKKGIVYTRLSDSKAYCRNYFEFRSKFKKISQEKFLSMGD